ncbi:Galectin-3-binding protein [Exaiptasia diaphana]|nr:Galectin-3-binding protein [Exaiptasia diaphana]
MSLLQCILFFQLVFGAAVADLSEDSDLLKLLDELSKDTSNEIERPLSKRKMMKPQAWKEDPQAWKQDPHAWKQDPQAWKQDPQAWKQDPQAWKQDPQAWKQDPQAWKQDPQAWKQDPQAWKQDPQAWKQDPQAWKQDPQAWKEDPQAWKQDPQAWKKDKKPLKVRVRLVSKQFRNMGRVEVLYRGRWGSVCDRSWNRYDANVVCRQLGYPRALAVRRGAHFGQSKGPIWMDNVRCTGRETNLGMCRFNGWGKHRCRHSNDVGVVCQPKETLKTYHLCENHNGVLRCPSRKRLWIVYANYGRTSGRSVCPHSNIKNTRCLNKSSSQGIRCACHGKSSCRLYAKNEVYGDSCPGTHKYIEVRYKCV